MKSRYNKTISGVSLIVLLATANSAVSQPTEALLEVRRHFTDPDINTLTFHNIDEIFETRAVEAGEAVWELPVAPVPLDFTYEFQGEHYQAEEFPNRTYTNALLIMKDGKIVSEQYFNLTNEETHFLSMSTAKSITSILIGMAIDDGLIESENDLIVDYIPELKDSGYQDVTIRHALLMRSGTNWDERYDFEQETPMSRLHHGAIVENRFRFTEPALELQSIHPPGTVFNYSTLETGVLGWLLERASGMPLQQYMSERWWQPAGMESYGFWIADGPAGIGRVVNGMGFNAVLRDYARIGLTMLEGGKANARQLLPAAWVRKSTEPNGTEPAAPGQSRGYQYQWWTLADSNAYMAIGLQGQYIYVDPDTDTVVVKLSYFPPGEQQADAETEAFLRAVSGWSPKVP